MSKTLLAVVAVLACGIASPALAQERPDHFKGEKATTLAAAVNNFSEYNQRLEALVSKDELSAQDMHNVHQLTYTLENALEKIEAEFGALAETLEAVHVASEHGDTATVKTQGERYLGTAREIVK